MVVHAGDCFLLNEYISSIYAVNFVEQAYNASFEWPDCELLSLGVNNLKMYIVLCLETQTQQYRYI